MTRHGSNTAPFFLIGLTLVFVLFIVLLFYLFGTHTSWKSSLTSGSRTLYLHIPIGSCMLILSSSWACRSSFLCTQASAVCPLLCGSHSLSHPVYFLVLRYLRSLGTPVPALPFSHQPTPLQTTASASLCHWPASSTCRPFTFISLIISNLCLRTLTIIIQQ